VLRRCIVNPFLFIQKLRHVFHGALAGVGWMLVACFFFSVMAVFVKQSRSLLYFPEILLYRSFPTICILGVVMPYRGYSLKTGCLKEQLYRATFGSISMALGFWANVKLPLGLSMALSYTTPIFLALLMFFWFKQPLGRGLSFCVLMGFVGVVVLLRPTGVDVHHLLASFSALGAGLFAAMAFMNIQLLAKSGEPEWRTVFYFAFLSAVYAGLSTVVSYGSFHPITWDRLTLMLGLGLPGLMGQLCLTRAYGRGHPSVTSLFSYSTILLSTLWGWLFFGEHLDALTWIGGSIVLGSGLLATWLKRSPSSSEGVV
jgi:drug/metabolite transporter (DMT)-like permease